MSCGARSAVIQSAPGRVRSAVIRACVIIPRSPTKVTSVRPKRSRTAAVAAMNAVGSAVLPANTSTATGRPSASARIPYSICGLPRLPSRECPRAASGQAEPSIHELDRSNSAIRDGFAAGARCRAASLASIASCRCSSQSIAA